jgi:hypothetical protein
MTAVLWLPGPKLEANKQRPLSLPSLALPISPALSLWASQQKGGISLSIYNCTVAYSCCLYPFSFRHIFVISVDHTLSWMERISFPHTIRRKKGKPRNFLFLYPCKFKVCYFSCKEAEGNAMEASFVIKLPGCYLFCYYVTERTHPRFSCPLPRFLSTEAFVPLLIFRYNVCCCSTVFVGTCLFQHLP